MYREAAEFIQKQLPHGTAPEIGLILGSGLGALAESVENPIIIDYRSGPVFHKPRWKGIRDDLSSEIIRENRSSPCRDVSIITRERIWKRLSFRYGL